MIRILHVVTHMNRGGLETMLMNYYRNINRENIQFDFLVHRENRADYDDEIEQLGGKIYRLSVLNPFSIRYRKELDSFFKNHPEYQIVHVHQDCLSSVILKAAEKNHVKVRIAHSHNANQDRNLKYPIKLFYRRFIEKYSTCLMACGEAAGNWMFSGAPFQILNNAIDSEQYSFDKTKRIKTREKFGIGEKELVIGHIGRFSQQKNHEFIIKVFDEILKRTDAILLLVGDGELRSETEKQAEDLGIKDKIIFAGVRSDVPDLLQAMDVFLFPSLYEGLPVTMVEAQAAGLQCVISDRISDKCIITEGLVSVKKLSDSPDAWAETVLEEARQERKNTDNEIKQSGYDIKENAAWLEAFYMSNF